MPRKKTRSRLIRVGNGLYTEKPLLHAPEGHTPRYVGVELRYVLSHLDSVN